MDRSLATPCVQISYSFWFLHSNSTTPRTCVFNPKYLRCSPSSKRCLPGHAGRSLQTSTTTSVAKFEQMLNLKSVYVCMRVCLVSGMMNAKSKSKSKSKTLLFFFLVMVLPTCLLFIFSITWIKFDRVRKDSRQLKVGEEISLLMKWIYITCPVRWI